VPQAAVCAAPGHFQHHVEDQAIDQDFCHHYEHERLPALCRRSVAFGTEYVLAALLTPITFILTAFMAVFMSLNVPLRSFAS